MYIRTAANSVVGKHLQLLADSIGHRWLIDILHPMLIIDILPSFILDSETHI